MTQYAETACEGSAVPVCQCGHSWSDHSDHGDRCLVCDCPTAQYDGTGAA